MTFAFATLVKGRCWVAAMASAASMMAVTGIALAADPPAWPDTPEMRLAALALIETLNAEVLASRSATLTIEKWCADHRLGDRAAHFRPSHPRRRQAAQRRAASAFGSRTEGAGQIPAGRTLLRRPYPLDRRQLVRARAV